MKTRNLRYGTAIILLLLSSLQVDAADGSRTVQYSQADVIPIHAKLRYSTLIVLPADEEILDFTTGDKEFWIINGAHNLCYVHPAQAGIRSNLNLVTASGRVYSFLLTEIGNDASVEPDLKLFVVPKDQPSVAAGIGARYVRASEADVYRHEAEAARAEAAEAARSARASSEQQVREFRENYPGRLQFDYHYDQKAARPPFSLAAMYHDDKFTYIRCNAQEKPTIYELKDGKPILINFQLNHGMYVIPKIVDHGYVAIGKQKVAFDRRG
jgi:type IV secretion system protein VirB9